MVSPCQFLAILAKRGVIYVFNLEFLWKMTHTDLSPLLKRCQTYFPMGIYVMTVRESLYPEISFVYVLYTLTVLLCSLGAIVHKHIPKLIEQWMYELLWYHLGYDMLSLSVSEYIVLLKLFGTYSEHGHPM